MGLKNDVIGVENHEHVTWVGRKKYVVTPARILNGKAHLVIKQNYSVYFPFNKDSFVLLLDVSNAYENMATLNGFEKKYHYPFLKSLRYSTEPLTFIHFYTPSYVTFKYLYPSFHKWEFATMAPTHVIAGMRKWWFLRDLIL